ncbi:hypothetical protein QOT17_000466 [Balamuthia mandrillaris]
MSYCKLREHWTRECSEKKRVDQSKKKDTFGGALRDTKGKSGSQSQVPAQKDSAGGKTGSMNIVVKNARCLPRITLKISGGRTVEAALDSCATDSFVRETLLPKEVNMSSLNNGDMWRSATGHEVKPKGYVTLRFRTPTRENVKATVAVLAEDDPMPHDFLIMRANLWKETQDVVDVIYPVELPTEEVVMTGLRELVNDADLDRAESTASRAGP